MRRTISNAIAQPKVFWLTVNRQCNFRCCWCYARDTKFAVEQNMTLHQAQKIVDLALLFGVKRLILIGGEPTLWEHLFEFNQYCKSKSIVSCLITNACLFGDDSFFKHYMNSPCDYVSVSIKGINREQFAQTIQTPHLFGQTINGIRNVINFHKHKATVSTVCSNLTSAEDLIKIVDVVQDMGAASFMLSLCTATLEGNHVSDKYMLSFKELASILPKVYPYIHEKFAGKCVMELSMPLCIWPENFIELLIKRQQLSSICHFHDRSGLVFDTNGDILPCNSMINCCLYKKPSDGVYRYDDLMQKINSPKIQHQFSQMQRYPSLFCKMCKYKHYCRGGCILNWAVLDPKICSPF